MAKKKPKQWAWLPASRTSHPAVDATFKAQTETKVRKFIEEVLKPQFVKPPPEDSDFNYVTDITLKWQGTSLFLVKIYACPGPNAIEPSFEDRFARMRHASGDRFDLAFMRHTGQWVELYQGKTIEECLASIRDDPWFQV